MERKSGEQDAPKDAIQIINGVVLSGEWQQQAIMSTPQVSSFRTFEEDDIPDINPVKMVSSKDLGDPEIDTVLQWHLSLCQSCRLDVQPPAFGVPATNLCPEYWEIIDEYREYEGYYAWIGNP